MNKTDYLTIGADVEYFVAPPYVPNDPAPKPKRNAGPDDNTFTELIQQAALAETKGRPIQGDVTKIVPCVGYCPGTKEKPFTPAGWPDGFAVQEDNVMLEVNVPVSKSPTQFGRTLQIVNNLAQEFMKVHNLIPVLNLSEYTFRPKDLTSPQAQNFACDPDFDAYSGGAERTNQPDMSNLRTCGGHIHMGGNFKCPDWVAVLFFELGLYQTYGSEYVCPTGTERRNWYGRPGTFRPKPYGIEYRTMGNWWSYNRSSAEDVGRTFFRTGEWLINTPAQVIQVCFRTIKWSLMQKIMLVDYRNEEGQIDLKLLKRDRMALMHSVNAARMGI